MTNVETRLPCPVCLGVTMTQTPVQGPVPFTLDHCGRCGGAWFDTGEVQQLRQVDPQDFWKQIANVEEGVHQMQCHSCGAQVSREDEKCPACRWRTLLDCPKCGRVMSRDSHGGVMLDSCAHCKGVWFDRHELQEVWSLNFTNAIKQQRADGMSMAGWIALDAATDPFVLYYGAHAVGGLIQSAPEIAGGVADAAGSVFEVIVDIISSFFD